MRTATASLRIHEKKSKVTGHDDDKHCENDQDFEKRQLSQD
jgi:hypothetical protein